MVNQSGHRIRAARHLHNPKLTQDDLIAKMHTRYNIILTKSGLSRIENGQRYVTDQELVAFSKILGVSIEWLLGETADPTVKKSF